MKHQKNFSTALSLASLRSTSVTLLFFCSMYRMQNIRRALVSKELPIVQGKCSVISAKVTYNTSQETRNSDKQWIEICAKRDAWDKAMKKIREMAFFFSSVAVVEKKVQKNECEEGKDGDDETVNNYSQRKKKIYWPAISKGRKCRLSLVHNSERSQ